MKRSMKSLLFLIAAAAATSVPVCAQAGLLLYEGFDYTYSAASDELVGKTGGAGWNGTAWGEGGSATTGLRNVDVVSSSSLSFTDFPTTGNVGQVQNNHNSASTYGNWIASRPLPNTLSIPAGTTVYTSFLFRQEQNASYAFTDEARISASATGGATGYRVSPVTKGGNNNPDDVAFGYDTTTTSQTKVSGQKTPYLFISKYTNVNGAGTQDGTMWMLSAANWDAIKTGGITETELDANNVAKLTDTATGMTLAGGQYLQLYTDSAFGIQNNAYFDEVKVFTQLNDVTSTMIPEPASLVSLVGGIGLLMIQRRRA